MFQVEQERRLDLGAKFRPKTSEEVSCTVTRTEWLNRNQILALNKAVTAGGPSSSSAIGGVEIKVEHLQLVEPRGRVVVGKSATRFLERRLTEGKVLLSLLVARSKTQNSSADGS